MAIVRNLLAQVPADLATELTETLIERSHLRVERIVSQGQASPAGFWYDQEENEWLLVLCGRATLRLADDDRLIELGAGDSLELTAHTRHRVEWTDPDQPTVWLAVFYR